MKNDQKPWYNGKRLILPIAVISILSAMFLGMAHTGTLNFDSASENPHSRLAELNKKRGAERIELYIGLKPAERAEIWKEKLQIMLSKDWNKAQKGVLQGIHAECKPDLFASVLHKDKKKDLLNRAGKVFNAYQILRIFYFTDLELGGPEGPNQGGGVASDCTCKSGLYCSGFESSICRSANSCSASSRPGCGFMMQEQCDGTCERDYYAPEPWRDQ